jgi:ATP-dependent DNA helicase RecG
MLAIHEIRALLKKLDGQSADDLESETLEFMSWDLNPDWRKRQLRELREAVVCLANARGGQIVLGVGDGKRTRRESLHGVGPLDANEIRRAVYDGTDPPILVDIDDLVELEGRLLVIRVPQGIPPHTTSDGVAKIRIGKECKPLKGSELNRMLLSGGKRDLSAQSIPGATIQDLDGDQIRLLRQTIAAEAGNRELAELEERELLRNLGLLRDDEVTLAALLLLGSPAALGRWAPQHEVTYIHFKTATQYDARKDFKGPLLAVLAAVRDALERDMKLHLVQTRGFGELAFPDLTWQAAREAALNALVHRDYFLHQSVQIHVHKQRLEVSSPGGFIGGVTPQNILRHPPIRRNPLLAEVFQTIGLVNRAGMGVDRIYEELLRLGKGIPKYTADESHVLVALPLKTHEAFARFVAEETGSRRNLELEDLILLRAATERGFLDRWSAAEWLQVSEDDAAGCLASLRDGGYFAAHGRGRGTSYRLVPKLSDLLRGPGATDQDVALDDEAIRLRVKALLVERGRLSNAEIRRLSGYSRLQSLRLMRTLCREGAAKLVGRGRAAHYRPGPAAVNAGRKR